MIILYTFLIGMTLFTLQIAIEWVRVQFRSVEDAFSKPIATFQREHRSYMVRPCSARK